MFSRIDADQLRESLASVDFNKSGASSPLLESYFDHYGLNFSSQELSVQHSAGIFESGQFEIVCHHFAVPIGEQKGTAFLLHGYFDHTGIFRHLIKHCIRQGYAVVIFDMPGHGLSSGSSASIDSFRQYTQALLDCLEVAQRQHVNQPWIAIGQSTGAAVMMDAILDRKLTDRFLIEHYILLGPLLRPRGWTGSNILFAVSRWFLSSTQRTFSKNSHDKEFLYFVKHSDAMQSQRLPHDWVVALIDYQKRFAHAEISDQSLTIIQGTGDETVDWQYNLPQIEKKFPGSRTYMIAEARHHLANESPEFRDRVFSLIDQIVE